ncbi:hypothetical protein [Thauera humireducens]|uniref:hypothetical protein n=1 Tax=Thauera humireducens TaxID=1134435 RepID=UPI00311F2E6D
MISRIIEAKPEDIRGFLEEAAGVTKYRERRKETEGRLRDARDNLACLDDIRMELGERIAHPEAQAEVAARYNTLSAAHVQKQQLLWLLKRNSAGRARALSEELNATTQRIEGDSARCRNSRRRSRARAKRVFREARRWAWRRATFVSGRSTTSRNRTAAPGRGAQATRSPSRATRTRPWPLAGTESAALLKTASAGRRWPRMPRCVPEQAEARHFEIADRVPDLESAPGGRYDPARRVRAGPQTEQQLRVEEATSASAMRARGPAAAQGRLEAERGAIAGPDERELARGAVRGLQDALEVQQQDLQQQARQPDAKAGAEGCA